MARLNDLDDRIDAYLQFLKGAYYETDPNKGEDGEIAKHELAGLAIEKFWYLHLRHPLISDEPKRLIERPMLA
jgi:hypothetical protein